MEIAFIMGIVSGIVIFSMVLGLLGYIKVIKLRKEYDDFQNIYSGNLNDTYRAINETDKKLRNLIGQIDDRINVRINDLHSIVTSKTDRLESKISEVIKNNKQLLKD